MIYFGLLVVFFLCVFLLWFFLSPQFNPVRNQRQKEAFEKSPHYKDGKFQNLEPTPLRNPDSPVLNTIKELFNGEKNRTPRQVIETEKFDKEKFLRQKDLQAVWFGHSTVLLNAGGCVILLDPIFSKRASPLSFAGTKVFPFRHTPKAEDLPDLDVVIISHDHYDHLDYQSIRRIKERVKLFCVPLGLSGYLLRWGVEASRIIELDWWQSHSIKSAGGAKKAITLTCTPARHFSGRKVIDMRKTQWSSWVIQTAKGKVYFSGDSGYGIHYKQVGQKYGPFELAILECGQYNEDWKYVHELPFQIMDAVADLRARKILPVHWGKYLLSLHAWTDPMERLFGESAKLPKKARPDILTPKIGSVFNILRPVSFRQWWLE